jgi:hypothetical protein
MSQVQTYNPLILNDEQEVAMAKLKEFLSSDGQVFLLKGYAGTGKTTIIKEFINYLSILNKPYELMAPTGRAAKILREKTDKGITIHRGIYNLEKLESVNKDAENEAEHDIHYYFPIRTIDNNQSKIIIIDEASMISSKENKSEIFSFGTDILLNDILTYASLKTSNNKIVFVGDPAQLPPVGDNQSLALEKDFFQSLDLKIDEVELRKVMRQQNNLILHNAEQIRNIIESEAASELVLSYDSDSYLALNTNEIIDKYIQLFPKPEIGNGVVISYSNAQCSQYNWAIRERYFPFQQSIQVGDLLLINNNNYHTYGVELYNGDIVKVVSESTHTIKQSAPVMCDVKGEKVKKVVTLDFREITIELQNNSTLVKCLIIDSLLHSIHRDLSVLEMKALYINFVMRFRQEQTKRKEDGLPFFKVGSLEFKEALKSDPFYNALRVKFGYAITCHKAQGGEWDKVFVDYTGRVSLKKDPMRWCYTATTRGINTVYAINAPSFAKYRALVFDTIGLINDIPKNILTYSNIQVSPFHLAEQHKCKSMMYWELLEKLETTDYSIINVETFGYQERYTIKYQEQTFFIQANHRDSGLFLEKFHVTSDIDPSIKSEIEYIFNEHHLSYYSIDYTPSKDFLAHLYSMVQDVCGDLEISILNVVEDKYFVNYYFKTDAIVSYIQFYFNKNNVLTKALPKSFKGVEDSKLVSLINKLTEHAK